MKISDIRIFPVGGAKLKAFVSIIIDGCFIISDIKVIEGNKGLFLSMPSKKRKNGTFKDIAHPLNSETREMMEKAVVEKYEEVMAEMDVAPSELPSADEAEESVDIESPSPDPAPTAPEPIAAPAIDVDSLASPPQVPEAPPVPEETPAPPEAPVTPEEPVPPPVPREDLF